MGFSVANTYRRLQERSSNSVRRIMGSVWPKKYDLEDEIDNLYMQMRGLEEMKHLHNYPGWKRLRAVAERYQEVLELWIVGMSDEPVKNEKNIVRCWAMREAIGHLFDFVEGPASDSDRISDMLAQRIGLLEQVADLPRSSEVETAL